MLPFGSTHAQLKLSFSSTAAFLRSVAASNVRASCSLSVLQLDEGGFGQHRQRQQVLRPHLRNMRDQDAHARREVLEMPVLLGCALLQSNLPTHAVADPQGQLLPKIFEGQEGAHWFPPSGWRWNRLERQFADGRCVFWLYGTLRQHALRSLPAEHSGRELR